MKEKDSEAIPMPKLLEIEENLCREIFANKYDCEVSKARHGYLLDELGRLCYNITEASKKIRRLAMEADDVVVMDNVRLEIMDLINEIAKLAEKYNGIAKDYTENLEKYAFHRETICEMQMELGEVQSMIRKKATEEASSSSNS